MVSTLTCQRCHYYAEIEVFIASYARTPIGSFQGSLASFSACELGAIAIKDAVKRAGLADNVNLIDEVVMGNVLSAGIGQAPANHAATLAGLPVSIPAMTINKVCASGMKAIMIAANAISSGQADIVVAGGMESMSRAPFLLPSACRTGGLRYGDQSVIDTIKLDGLTDAGSGLLMGLCGEKCASDHQISREDSDRYAMRSYERAIQSKGQMAKNTTPLEVAQARGKPAVTVDQDEGLMNYNPEKMRQLKTIFKESGTVTAANASPMSDGAAALIICSGKAVRQYRLPVLARITGWADANQIGIDFTTSPALAIPKALAKAGRQLSEVEYFEINEAFSSVALANINILGLDGDNVNVWGGSVALGHPLGCSGARITGNLTSILEDRGARIGVAAVCNGGGGASALVLERVDSI